jgi:hypothetical protein
VTQLEGGKEQVSDIYAYNVVSCISNFACKMILSVTYNLYFSHVLTNAIRFSVTYLKGRSVRVGFIIVTIPFRVTILTNCQDLKCCKGKDKKLSLCLIN